MRVFWRLLSPVWRRLAWLPWGRAASGAVLASLALGGAWWWLDGRLAAEAPRRAAAGELLAVSTLRSDWPRSVVPVALTAPGAPGKRARDLAAARVDLAVSRALPSEAEAFSRVATEILQAVRETEGPLTPTGAAWGRWVTTRLAGAGDSLPADRRLALLTLSDSAMAALAAKAKLPEAPTEQPAEPTILAFRTAPPLPTLVPPPLPTVVPVAEPLVEREPAPFPEPIRRDLEWQSPLEPVTPIPEEPVASVPPPSQSLTDRELLAELLRVSREVAAAESKEAIAAGPASMPKWGEDAARPTTAAELLLEELRIELARRGYQRVLTDHAEAVLSPEPATRLALVDRLLLDRSADAARLLLLLASDSAGEVRAAAVSALGSTTNPALVRAALNIAVRDPDPRVGRMAAPLRRRLR